MHSKSSSRIASTLTALILCAAFAGSAWAIPICGDGFCDRNNFVLPETIYNCPQDCCGGLAPTDSEAEQFLSFLTPSFMNGEEAASATDLEEPESAEPATQAETAES